TGRGGTAFARRGEDEAAARVVAGVTPCRGDATREDEPSGSVVEEGLAGHRGMEAGRLEPAGIADHDHARARGRALPEERLRDAGGSAAALGAQDGGKAPVRRPGP